MYAEILFIIACAMNAIAAYLNLRTIRQWRRRIEENRETFERLLTFAAFMSHAESGAPDYIRDLARQALPDGAKVELFREPPTLH